MNQPWSDYDSDWFIGLNSTATNSVKSIHQWNNQLTNRKILHTFAILMLRFMKKLFIIFLEQIKGWTIEKITGKRI